MMQQAASNQAQTGTADIGTPEQFRAIALDGANQLDFLRTSVIHQFAQNNNLRPDLLAKARSDEIDAATVSLHLRDIADSQTDQAFVTAVFSMCDADSQKASANIGPILTRIGLGITNDPSFPANIRPQLAAYWQTFGARLTAVPDKCAKAEQGMAEAKQRAQQAEASYEAQLTAASNVAAALLAGAAIYAGARASTVEQQQASFQQLQTQIELRNLDSDLRRQNTLLQQQAQPAPVPTPAPPIRVPGSVY
jgi:hypothetical protein